MIALTRPAQQTKTAPFILILMMLAFIAFCEGSLANHSLDPISEPREPALGERILSLGSWGADVFHVQQILTRIGYELVSDGHFGRATQRAIIAFQLDHNLKPDGIVGPQTAAALLNWRPSFTYVVQAGDSLWTIAERFDTTVAQLIALNPLMDEHLRIGTRINVPSQTHYTVQAGDTLSAIALRFDTTVHTLALLNDIEDPNRIRSGMRLRLPPQDVAFRLP